MRNESVVDRPSADLVQDFDAFFRAEYPAVVRFAVALTGDLGAAEDLAQDAFIAARNRWDTISRFDWPAGWVRRAVANRSASRGRRLVAEARALAKLAPKQSVELEDVHDAVWNAVRQLPARQAQVVALLVLEDRTVADVACVLECGEETVRTHYRRARARLAVLLDEEDPWG